MFCLSTPHHQTWLSPKMLQEISRRAVVSTLPSPLIKSSSFSPFSSSTPHPLYYDLIHYRPARRNPPPPPPAATPATTPPDSDPIDRSKRRYYFKRQNRLYGDSSSSSSSSSRPKSDFVELKPEIVDFPRLHAREQELHFHDAFAFPWEKDKHYRMVHQLEKKFFPDQSFEKAFAAEDRPGGDDGALLFFGEEEKKAAGGEKGEERKVEEFFKLLKKKKKDPNVGEDDEDGCRPFLSCGGTGLPGKWDGPSGTVVLVDKPKGWLSCKGDDFLGPDIL